MKKSLTAIVVVLLLVFVLGGVLAACANTQTIPADNSDVSEPQEEPSAPTASEVLSQAFAALPSGETVNFEWEAGANIGGSEYKVSLKGNAAKVYYLSDVDADYLAQVVQKGLARLDKVIKDLNILGMDLNGVVNLLVNTMAAQVSVQQAEGRTDYAVIFNTVGLQSLLDLVGAIIDLDSVTLGNIKLGALLDNLFAAIGGGEVEVGLSITGGVLSNVSAAVRNNGSDLVTLNTAKMEISSTAADYGIPEAVKNAADMSVTNLAFSAKLNVNGESVDAGKLVNMFAGKALIPEGAITVDADAAIVADVAIDLDLNYDGKPGDNNFAAVELYLGEGREQLLASLYYKNGALYIGALGDLASNENFKFAKVEVNGLPAFISSLVSTVTGAIDSELGTQWTRGGVAAVSLNGQGQPGAAGNIYSVLSFLCGILGMDTDFAAADGDTFTLDLNKALERVNATFGTNLDISEYGNIGVELGFDGAKLSSIGVNYSHSELGLSGNFTLDDILWGPQKQFEGKSISEYIDGKISSGGVIAAGENITDAILSAGVDIQAIMGANLTLAQGKYDIAALLEGFGVDMPKGLGLDVTLDGDFVMPLEITLQASLREKGTAVMLKAIAAQDIKLGDEVMFTQGTPVITALVYDGGIYLDLSNITVAGISLGKIKANFDVDGQIKQLLDGLLANIDLEINIPSLTGVSAAALASAEGEGGALTASEAIALGIYSDRITAQASVQAIIGLLNNLGVNFKLEGFEGELTAEVMGGDYGALVKEASAFTEGFNGMSGNIAESVLALVNNKKINMKMQVSSPNATQLALGEVLTALLGTEIPLNINLGSFDAVINIDLAYNINMDDMAQNKLLLEMKYGENEANKLILGAYITDNKLYVDLTGLGFSKFCLPADTILTKLMDVLGSLMSADVAASSGAMQLSSRALVNGINANISYDLAQAVFLALGVKLDFNIEAEGSVDISGGEGVSAVVNLGNDARAEANISITEMTEWEGMGEGLADGYTQISGENSRKAIVDLIKALNLNLSMDITNYNAYGGGGYYYTRIKLETLTSERSVAGKAIGAGNLLATIQKVDSAETMKSGSGSTSDLIYVVIYTDGENSGLRVLLNQGVAVINAQILGFTIQSIDLSSYIDISVDLDLVGTLADLIEGILVPASEDTSSGTGEAAALDDEGSESADSGLNVDIKTLLTGIDVNLLPDKVGVEIGFDAYTMNSLIDSVMRMLLGSDTAINVAELDLGFGTGVVKDSYLAGVRYDRTSASFQSDLRWAIAHDDGSSLYGFLGDIVRNELNNMDLPLNLDPGLVWSMAVKDSAVSVGQTIADWLYGVLSFPVWNEVTASASIVNGKIANIELYGVNNGQAVTSDEGAVLSANISYANQGVETKASVSYNASTMSALKGSFTRISIYNQSASVTNSGGWLVDWDNTPGRVVYNPYLYASADEAAAELIKQFDTAQTVIAQNAGSYMRATQLTYTYEGENLTREKLAELLAAPGTYNVTATAYFNGGVTLTRQIPVISRDTNGDYAIKSVSSDIHQGSLPDYIDVVYACGKTERLDASGMQFTYSEDGMSITSVTFPGDRAAECNISVIPVTSVNGATSFNVSAFDIYRALNGLGGVLGGEVTVQYADGTVAVLNADWRLAQLLEGNSSQAGFTARGHEITLGNSAFKADITVSGTGSVRLYADEVGTPLTVTAESVLPSTVYVKAGERFVAMPAVWSDGRSTGGSATAIIGYDVKTYNESGAFKATEGLEWMLLTFKFEV